MARAGGLRPDGLSIHHTGRKTGEKRLRPPSPNFFGPTTTEGNTHASSKPSIHERQPVPLSFRPQEWGSSSAKHSPQQNNDCCPSQRSSRRSISSQTTTTPCPWGYNDGTTPTKREEDRHARSARQAPHPVSLPRRPGPAVPLDALENEEYCQFHLPT